MRLSVWIASGLIVLAAPSYAKALASVESRTGGPVVRSGGTTSGTSLQGDDRALRTLKQIESLQQEMSELRGLVETQDHEIQQLKKSQKDLYLDLDKRLTDIQQKPSSAKEKRTSAAPIVTEPKATQPILKTSEKMETPGVLAPLSVSSASSSPAMVVASAHESEKEAYDAAYSFVRSKQYPEAIGAFQDYLSRFTEGEYAASANYWLGEVYLVQWQADKTNTDLLDKAISAFSNLTAQFPKHPKMADALLKLGIVENEKGNSLVAKEYFIDVKNRYPGSAAARIAESRLQQLE